MNAVNQPENNHQPEKLSRAWRLAADLDIKPVEELPQDVIAEIVPGGKLPEGHFGIQRKNTRTYPKIVNRDVVDVLRAFGEDGSTYDLVLDHFVRARNLDRDELDEGLKKLVITLIHANFLVEKDSPNAGSSGPIQPAFSINDTWLRYYVLDNVVCVVDSEIYKVADCQSGQPWALKITRPSFPVREMKEKIAERLSHEFAVMQKINHPNVVKLRACGEFNGQTYGILEWVDGPTVFAHAYPESDTPIDDAKMMALGLECVDALEAVHRCGYLHGDVHTSNFLTRDGKVCLIDFGLARPIVIPPEDTARYSEGGVMEYMPPEAIRRSVEKTDALANSVPGEVYSCAVILFLLFTKHYPYKRQFYRKDYINTILNEPPLSFEQCERVSWPELEAVLHKAMAKNPADRYQSLAEFRAALTAIDVPTGSGDKA